MTSEATSPKALPSEVITKADTKKELTSQDKNLKQDVKDIQERNEQVLVERERTTRERLDQSRIIITAADQSVALSKSRYLSMRKPKRQE